MEGRVVTRGAVEIPLGLLDNPEECSEVWFVSLDTSLTDSEVDVDTDVDAEGILDIDDDDDDADDKEFIGKDPGALFLRAKSLASFESSGTSLVTVTISPAKSYVVVIVTILEDDPASEDCPAPDPVDKAAAVISSGLEDALETGAFISAHNASSLFFLLSACS